jgi:hypothetical protein
MRIRGVLALGLGLIGSVIALACSAPDPGVDPLGDPRNASLGTPKTTPTTGGKNSGSPKDAGGAPPTTTDDAGNTNPGPVDAGAAADAATGPVNAFTNDGTYASAPNADKAALHHTVAVQGFTNPAGKDCMTCHGGAGPGVQFAFGGTVFTTAAGTTPAADVEVRVVDPKGAEQGSVHSDTDGNFWVVSNTKLPTGALAGARNGAKTQLMISNPSGGCSSTACHAVGSAIGAVHVP